MSINNLEGLLPEQRAFVEKNLAAFLLLLLEEFILHLEQPDSAL